MRVGLSALTVAEYFREDLQQDVLLFIDNIFRFVQAGSEVSALLGRLNSPGQYVKLDATISGLTGLAEGDYDDVDEQAFYLIGDMSTLKTSSHGEATGKS